MKTYLRHLPALTIAFILLTFVVSEGASGTAAVEFLNEKQAALAIVDDSAEPYFDHLQPMEMEAKTGSLVAGKTIEEQRMQCRRAYQKGVRKFTENEERAIRYYVGKIKNVLANKYPLIGNIPWSFIKISDDIEGGLPHTRGNHIILSESFCSMIASAINLQPMNISHFEIIEILTHEQMHVFQRKYPNRLDSLYTDVWGFQNAKEIVDCQWLIKHHLANPDAVSCPWILAVNRNGKTKYLWPLVVFSEGNTRKRMPDDFRMIAIYLTKKAGQYSVQVTREGKPAYQDLFNVAEFRHLFPLTSSIYHPDEASADMFGKMIIFDDFLDDNVLSPQEKKTVEKYTSELRRWFKDNLRE